MFVHVCRKPSSSPHVLRLRPDGCRLDEESVESHSQMSIFDGAHSYEKAFIWYDSYGFWNLKRLLPHDIKESRFPSDNFSRW